MRTTSGKQARCIQIGDEIVLCMLPNAKGKLKVTIEGNDKKASESVKFTRVDVENYRLADKPTESEPSPADKKI